MVVILFATRGSIPLKNDHDEEFKLSSRLQHRVLVHFFQVLLTWLNLFGSLQ